MLRHAAEQPASPALRAGNRRLQQQVAALTAQVADLQAQPAALKDQLAAALAAVEGLRRGKAVRLPHFPQAGGRKTPRSRGASRDKSGSSREDDGVAAENIQSEVC